MSEKKFTPQDLEARIKQREAAMGNVMEMLKPWLFEVGNWIFGGLIAFNIIVVGALLAVGPSHTEVVISIAAFACALPLNVSGLILLKIFHDIEDLALEDLMKQAFLDANIPDVDKLFPEAEVQEAEAKRRTDMGLRYSLYLAALSTVLTTVGIIAALWYMAWWVGVIFIVTMIASTLFVMTMMGRRKAPETEAQAELRRRYQEEYNKRKQG